MQHENFKYGDNKTISSSREDTQSPLDFAAGKTHKGILKKKVKFIDNHEGNTPQIDKYKHCEDEVYEDKRHKHDVISGCLQDIDELCKDMQKVYRDLTDSIGEKEIRKISKNYLIADTLGEYIKIEITSEKVNSIKENSKKIFEEFRKNYKEESPEKTIKDLREQIDHAVMILEILNGLKVEVDQYHKLKQDAGPSH